MLCLESRCFSGEGEIPRMLSCKKGGDLAGDRKSILYTRKEEKTVQAQERLTDLGNTRT